MCRRCCIAWKRGQDQCRNRPEEVLAWTAPRDHGVCKGQLDQSRHCARYGRSHDHDTSCYTVRSTKKYIREYASNDLQRASILAVGVKIVLVLARICRILGPAIEGCATVAAVQVHRVRLRSMVDEPNDCLSSLGHVKGRTRSNTIVADQLSLRQTRIDLLFQ